MRYFNHLIEGLSIWAYVDVGVVEGLKRSKQCADM